MLPLSGYIFHSYNFHSIPASYVKILQENEVYVHSASLQSFDQEYDVEELDALTKELWEMKSVEIMEERVVVAAVKIIMAGDEVYPRQCPCRRAFNLGSELGTWRTRRRSDESRGTRGFTQVQPPQKVKGLRPACLTLY
jgi:hypothetical protein